MAEVERSGPPARATGRRRRPPRPVPTPRCARGGRAASPPRARWPWGRPCPVRRCQEPSRGPARTCWGWSGSRRGCRSPRGRCPRRSPPDVGDDVAEEVVGDDHVEPPGVGDEEHRCRIDVRVRRRSRRGTRRPPGRPSAATDLRRAPGRSSCGPGSGACGRRCARPKASRTTRSTPYAVLRLSSVATSWGVPLRSAPPEPAYGPSVPSRTTTMSMVAGVPAVTGLVTPGYSRTGRRLTWWSSSKRSLRSSPRSSTPGGTLGSPTAPSRMASCPRSSSTTLSGQHLSGGVVAARAQVVVGGLDRDARAARARRRGP